MLVTSLHEAAVRSKENRTCGKKNFCCTMKTECLHCGILQCEYGAVKLKSKLQPTTLILVDTVAETKCYYNN